MAKDISRLLRISSNKYFLLISFFFLLCILQNLQIWLAVYFSSKTVSLVIGVTLCIISLHYYDFFKKDINIYLFFTATLLTLYIVFLDGLYALAQVIPYIAGLFLFQLKDFYKNKLLNLTTKVISAIVAVGLLFYILWLIIDFPPVGRLVAPFYYQDHDNYIFFINPVIYLIPRFSGPFIEPGHIGSMAVYLLYANNFNFKGKKYLWALLLGVLFSLSLAAYVLLFLCILIKIRVSIKTILLMALTGGLMYVWITEVWEDGNNPVNSMIFARLEYDDEKGIVGNNRTFDRTDGYYNDIREHSGLTIGQGSKFMNEMFMSGQIMGAGYKMFFMQFGYIGAILALLYYFFIANSCKNKRFAFGFLLIMIVSFIQRAYPFWMAWLLPFICSMNKFNLLNSIPSDK